MLLLQHPGGSEDSTRDLHLSEISFSDIINYCFCNIVSAFLCSRYFANPCFLSSLEVQHLAPLRMVSKLNRGHRVRPGERRQNGEVPTFILEKGGNLDFRAQW